MVKLAGIFKGEQMMWGPYGPDRGSWSGRLKTPYSCPRFYCGGTYAIDEDGRPWALGVDYQYCAGTGLDPAECTSWIPLPLPK